MTSDHHPLASPSSHPSHWVHSYPAHLSPNWILASGQSLRVRPIRHDDGEREEAFVLATNVAMLRLARSMGFAVNAEPGDATVVRIRRDLRPTNAQPH